MYIMDNGSDKIYQYNLTTAYDVSTAIYASKSLNFHGVELTPEGFCLLIILLKCMWQGTVTIEFTNTQLLLVKSFCTTHTAIPCRCN